MRRALALARRGQGLVEPNPMVGCVIVRDGAVLGQGHHRRFGGPHAEVHALAACRRAGLDPRGATVYVTLEPCCHHGKTPPCTDALIAADVARVIVAMKDPFQRVAGKGIAALRRAGIAVEVGPCGDEAASLNAPFVRRVTRGLPWVIAKWAQTLDGRTATRGGDSRWISNDQSRHQVHRLRARVDAVMVGIRTVLADDPELTARGVRVRRVARRVVIDPRLRLPERCRLIRTLDRAPLTVAARPQAILRHAAKARRLRSAGVEIVALPTGRSRSLRPLLEHLVRHHAAASVLVEGGATLLGSLLAQRLINEARVFVAPKLLGDQQARPALIGMNVPRIARAVPWNLDRVQRLGDDLMLRYLA